VNNEDLKVSGLIDGVNLTELSRKALNKNESPLHITQHVTVDNITVKGGVTLDGYLNHLNITEIFENALRRHGDQHLTGKYNIENIIIHGQLNVSGLINGLNFTKEVIQLYEPGHISGDVYFTDGLKANEITTRLLNNVNLTELKENTVFVDEDTVISGYKIFTTQFQVESNLQVLGLINGENWTSLVDSTLVKNANQTVKVPTNFKTLKLKTDLSVTNLFNGLNITQFEKDVVYKCFGPNRPITGQHVYKTATVERNSTVKNIVTAGTVDSVNVTKLFEESVLNTGSAYTIYDTKTLSDLHTTNLEVETINGYSIPDDFILLSDTNPTVTGSKRFMKTVHVRGNLTMSPNKTVNKCDVSEFKESVVYVDEDGSIKTDVEISGTMTITKNLNVGLFNNLNVSEDELLLKSSDQTVTGKKIIKEITVNEEVITQNHINGMDLGRMYNETIITGIKNTITGAKTIEGNVDIIGKTILLLRAYNKQFVVP